MKRSSSKARERATTTMGLHLRRKRGSVGLAIEANMGRLPTEILRGFIGSFCSSRVKPGGAGMEDGGLE